MTKIRDCIIQSNQIENVWSEQEIEQSMKAWESLESTSFSAIGHEVIKLTQKTIVENQPGLAANQRGEYRDISNTIVRIGNYIAPLPEEVPSLMNVWIDRWSYLKPFAAHLAFERIHPFADGNGRVGRLLMWRQEIENGDDLTFIPFDRRHKYYDALQAASTLAIELGLEKYISL